MRLTTTLASIIALSFVVVLPVPEAGAMTYEQLTAEMKTKGEAFRKKVQDMTLRQTMTMSDQGQTMTQKMTLFQKGKKSRMEGEMDMPGMGKVKNKSISDGKDHWVYSDMTGGWSKMPRSDRQVDPGDWYDGSKRKGEVVGDEPINGREAWKTLFNDDQGKETVWIDKKEYFPLKTQDKSRDGVTETFFTDFRDSGAGFVWPHKMEMLQNGKKKGTMVIESIKINTGLDDALFTVPKDAGSKQPNMQEMLKRFQHMQRDGGGD